MNISEKSKTVLKWMGFLLSGGCLVISLIALVVMIFGEGYNGWKWFNVITNLVFFGIAAWYFYFKQIKE